MTTVDGGENYNEKDSNTEGKAKSVKILASQRSQVLEAALTYYGLTTRGKSMIMRLSCLHWHNLKISHCWEKSISINYQF